MPEQPPCREHDGAKCARRRRWPPQATGPPVRCVPGIRPDVPVTASSIPRLAPSPCLVQGRAPVMLRVTWSNRLEVLADRLAAVLAVPAGDVLTPDVVVVQNAGMGRWVQLRLATAHG